MQITNKIDGLISKVNNTEPELSDDLSDHENKFTKLLKSNIETNYIVTDPASETEHTSEKKAESKIPSWVDQDYGYDPNNPRKPNMRELMEAMSGKSVENLYAEPDKNGKK